MKIDHRLASGLELNQTTINNVFDIDQTVEKRLKVAKALGQLKKPFWNGMEALLVKDPSSRVREQVAKSLGVTKDVEALSFLDKLADDGIPGVRLGVARGLLDHNSKDAINIVMKLLNDDNFEVRLSALRAYMRMQTLYPETTAVLSQERLQTVDPGSISGLVYYPGFAELNNKYDIVMNFLDVAETPEQAPSWEAGYKHYDMGQETGTWYTLLKQVAGQTPTEHYSTDPEQVGIFYSPTGQDPTPAMPEGYGPNDEPQPSSAQEKPHQRYVNSWFKSHPDPQEPLRYGQEYELGIQISPKLRIGSFTRGRPEFTEPEGSDQDTLDVVVAIVTDDFQVLEKPAKRIGVPRDTKKDSPIITFRVRPVKNNQDAFISILFYHENNLFHEALIGARVQVVDISEESRPTAYFPTENRFHALSHGRRDLNIQVIEEQYSYRFILFYDFGEDRFDVMWCKILVRPDRVERLLQGVRSSIKEAVYTKDCYNEEVFIKGEDAEKAARENRLPRLYTIEDTSFQTAAKALAKAGRGLFTNLFYPLKGSKVEREQARYVGKMLQDLSTDKNLKIQVLSDDFIIPWNLLYDKEIPDKEIDPQAFWGFKHVIEEIPYRIQEKQVKDTILVSRKTFGIGMNINKTKISDVLTNPQIQRVQKWHLQPSLRCTEDKVLMALRGAAPYHQLEYFYCHAGTADGQLEDINQSYLGLTSDKSGLTLEDIKLATIEHEFEGSPLFILNACESAQMDGRFYDGFVPKFLSMGASAVVGTDAEVPSLFGAHFGMRVLQGIMNGDSLGEILLSARREFLDRYRNPLGLIYRVFGNTDVRILHPSSNI